MVTRAKVPAVPVYGVVLGRDSEIGDISPGEITAAGGLVHNLKKMEHQLVALTQMLQHVTHSPNASSPIEIWDPVEVAGIYAGHTGADPGKVQVSDSLYGATYHDMTTTNGINDEQYITGTIRTWIDAIRSRAGIVAWNWSFGSDERVVMTGALIAEYWEAMGSLDEHSERGEGYEASVRKTFWDGAVSNYDWDGNGVGPAYWRAGLEVEDDLNYEDRHIYRFGEETRRSGVYTFLVAQHDDEGILHANTTSAGQWEIVHGVDSSGDAEDAWESTPVGTVITAQTTPDTGTHNDTYTDLIDLTGIHPTSGSGDYAYRVQYVTESPLTDTGKTNRRFFSAWGGASGGTKAFALWPSGGDGASDRGIWQPGKQ